MNMKNEQLKQLRSIFFVVNSTAFIIQCEKHKSLFSFYRSFKEASYTEVNLPCTKSYLNNSKFWVLCWLGFFTFYGLATMEAS